MLMCVLVHNLLLACKANERIQQTITVIIINLMNENSRNKVLFTSGCIIWIPTSWMGRYECTSPLPCVNFFFVYRISPDKSIDIPKIPSQSEALHRCFFLFFVLQNEKLVKTNLFTIIHSDLTDNYFVTPHSTHAYTHVCRTQEIDEE